MNLGANQRKLGANEAADAHRQPPLLSIITPSYQQGKYIEETIQSVLTQDYTNIEYIVIDGGSTDDTLDILKKYEDRLKWISGPDTGQSDAINKGFKMARGEIVAWLNSDDVYLPGCVGAAAKVFQEHPEAAMVYGKAYNINEKGENPTDCGVGSWDLFRLIHMRNIICQPAVFMRKSALETVGYLNENLHYAMDWDLWIRIGMEFPVVSVDDFWASNRDYHYSKTGSGAFRRLWECYLCTQYGVLRVPPALRAYAGEIILRWMNRRDLLWLNPLKDRLRQPIFRMLVRLFEQETGVYPGGLIGPKAFMTLRNPESKRDIRIQYGPIPHEMEDHVVKVNIRINDRHVGSIEVLPSQKDQSAIFRIPTRKKCKQLTHFEFSADRWKEIDELDRNKPLLASFLLENMEFI